MSVRLWKYRWSKWCERAQPRPKPEPVLRPGPPAGCLCVLIKLGSGGPGHSWMDKCLLVPPFSVLKLSLRDTPFLPLQSSKHLSQWFYLYSSALVNTGHVGATPEALEDISQARQTFPSFQSDTQQAPVGK